MKSVLGSRRRVVWLTLALLLLLDAARSIYVRIGFEHASSIWTPGHYAEMAWPPSANVPADAPRGRKVYLENCAFCHGPDGRGNGPSAPSMIPRPRDFTAGAFKYKSTAAGAPPSDADLARVIADGLHASAMPYWRDVLSAGDLRAVADYVKTFSPSFAQAAPAAIAVPPRVAPDDASVARGKALYASNGCAGCHGSDLRGGMLLQDAKGQPVISRDLGAPWTFRGGAAPEAIWMRLTTGLAPAPMPSYADKTSADERWDLVNYILASARKAPWEAGGRLDGPGHAADPEQRGRYLVRAEMCGLCHTEVSPHGVYREDRYLAGGMRVGAYPQGIFVSRNLTPDPDTGLGRWSEKQIADALRDGRAPEGTLNFWGMPWMYLHALHDDDARAIARYLKALPAVRNQIPHALRYGVVETIAAKLRGRDLPIARPPVLTYAPGSFAHVRGLLPDLVQGALAGAQWIVLGLGVVAFVFAAPRERRLPQSWRGWVATPVAVVLLGVAGLAGWFVYETPALAILPPERVAAGAAGSIPTPDTSKLPPERAALVERGRYLFNVASCAYCHTNDGAGGAKLSGGLGTIYTPNISSDPKAGLGGWSDAQIARAIRSGVSRNGRPLYWQGMPWDHFSNWDEEDIRAIVAYLRLLPPVTEPVPAYRPPAGDDCKQYTFWTSRNTEPGCR